jgi:hypothetical protein
MDQVYTTRFEQELAAMKRDDLRKLARQAKLADVQKLSKPDIIRLLKMRRDEADDGADAAEQKTNGSATDVSTGTALTGKRACQRARVVTVLVPNPKRAGTAAHARYELYRTGQTVQQFLDAGGRSTDLAWDVAHGHVKLEKKVP